MKNRIGVIAGGGQFPLLFAQAAQEAGREVVAIAHLGETDPELEKNVDQLYWVKLGQLGKILSIFRKEGIRETVLVGTITKTRMFRDVLPDLKGLALWNKIDIRQDDAILRAVADALEDEGIKVLESTIYLKQLFFPQGILTKQKPSPEQYEDIRFGMKIARSIGALDIGQSVVVRDKTVLAVEAIEGTDAAIRRGGSLGKENAVVIKVKKPNQDFRFDLPAIGTTTLESMMEVKAKVLAVEAGQALLFDRQAFIDEANRAGIIVVGVEDRDGEPEI
ncbi:LpxI family protein [Thermodesulfobacteriota bacterium]